MITLLLLAVFLVCVGAIWYEGLWSGIIAMFNLLLAGMMAINLFEPMAAFADQYAGTYTYFLDYVSIWLLFLIFFAILRECTVRLSKYRVRFMTHVEMAGRSIVALWVGWLMVGFVIVTLHMAPLPRNGFGGSFQQEPMTGDFLGFAPDRQWLGLVQSRSRGALKRSSMREFDPRSEFIFKYGSRRENLQKHQESTDSILVRTNS